MSPVQFDKQTRICGEMQGFLALPIKDTEMPYGNVMTSLWQPTGDEIQALIDGACVFMHVMGDTPQPVTLEVGFK